MYSEFIIFFITSFIISAVILYFLQNRQQAVKLKKFNDKGERWASQSKPIYGGVVFMTSFTVLFFALAIMKPSVTLTLQSIAIFIVVCMSFAMGLIDDIRSTKPQFKFLVQLFCSAILIYSDIYITISNISIINYLFTTFWVVGLMNSINMLDNMDAITASVSLTIISSFVCMSGFDNSIITYLCIGTMGSVFAFLFWNWNPAKIYMGDNGSQFLGIFLAVIGIVGIWNNSPQTSEYGIHSFKVLTAAIAAFIIPITDTTTVTINRLLQGKSPFVGGRDHTTHNLFFWGLKERYIAMLYITISIISNILAYYLLHINSNEEHMNMMVLINVISVIVFTVLYLSTRIKRKQTIVS